MGFIPQVQATNARTIDSDRLLFHAPFFNVNTSGNICMGNVNVREIERFESFDTALEYLENTFFNSVFTHSNNPLFDAVSIKQTLGEKEYNRRLFPMYNSSTDEQMTINDLL